MQHGFHNREILPRRFSEWEVSFFMFQQNHLHQEEPFP